MSYAYPFNKKNGDRDWTLYLSSPTPVLNLRSEKPPGKTLDLLLESTCPRLYRISLVFPIIIILPSAVGGFALLYSHQQIRTPSVSGTIIATQISHIFSLMAPPQTPTPTTLPAKVSGRKLKVRAAISIHRCRVFLHAMSDLDVIDGILLGQEIVDQGHGVVLAVFAVQLPNSLFLDVGDDVECQVVSTLVCKVLD